ncbi:MAG: VOC family protein [Actinomycetota bacterium]
MSLSGIHHIGFTVTDLDRSARFYEEVLGFKRVVELKSADGSHTKAIMVHEGFAIRVGLVQHHGSPAGLVQHHGSPARRFDETVPGMDHIAFSVLSLEELAEWERRFEAQSVAHSPIADSAASPGAKILVFRDPDNIQLELYAHG